MTAAQLQRAAAAQARLEARATRGETRDWMMQRRERTRRLIELGSLVEKSGLPELLGDDDRDASMYGALLSLVSALTDASPDYAPDDVLSFWRTRGRVALEAEGGDPGNALR